jgi:hypothetical protein
MIEAGSKIVGNVTGYDVQADWWFLMNYQPPNIIASPGFYGMWSVKSTAADVFAESIVESFYVLGGLIELCPGLSSDA